ncbi:MAG: radical SAM protein [Candidatus Heimdallarchaeota archaeon]|nr:radical SAM protein [Candidatus Heimdallarchaeota archaeon]
MKTKIRKLEGGSYLKGELSPGCKICRKGAELFFLVSGKCSENCYYCSLDASKRGKNIILANERPVTNFTGVMLEVSNMNALGAAITGGDPLLCVDKTVEYISKMKKEFGEKFHIHLYTSGRFANEDNLLKLYNAGLDEIRFHPQTMEQEKNIEKALNYNWLVGSEIPIIPNRKKEIISFLEYLDSLEGIKFCNMNELEATDANLKQLEDRGFKLVADDSSSIVGSEKLALQILKETDLSYSLHYCSSLTKDAVQFRNRLKRTAEIVRKPYEEIQDGMLVKAIIVLPSYVITEEIVDILIDEYEVNSELLAIKDKNKIETAWYIADVLKSVLFKRFEAEEINIIYQYPTYGRTIIGQTSLKEILK